MKLHYKNERTEQEIFDSIPDVKLYPQQIFNSKNTLIQCDNLQALKFLVTQHSLKGKIDLIYIDPPFATNNTFTISEGRANTISNSSNGTVAYKDTLKGAEFIEFLRERLVLLKMLLSNKGSIYLHIDYKIGHYVKVMMDEVFGIENFRNDITRIKCNPKNFSRKGYGNMKDLILFYSKSDNLIWNEPKVIYTEEDKLKLFPKKDKDGRHYTTIPLHAPGETKNGKTSQAFKGILPPKGRHWRSNVEVLEQLDSEGLIEWSDNGNPRKKIYFDEQEGKRMQDIWEFKDPQYPVYPTEKNPDLLDVIIKTSSNEDSIVLDCFCGSGTTLRAAQINGRHWLGIDQSDEAIRATTEKLNDIKGDLFISQTDFQLWTEKKNEKKKRSTQQGLAAMAGDE
ncbi:MAG: site-specific DNA-methyltransferase [Bacteroidetes bacterium]|nr:MAG: site-specific DNA-methyltransferase [Bacteroidota bacterium]